MANTGQTVVTNVDREIMDEIYRALVLLGAESDLLGVIGSWRESLPNEDVLAEIRAWNEATLRESKARIEHCEMSSHRLAYSQTEGR